MPPKKPNKADKVKATKKAEDMTFGLKNKSKSKVVQVWFLPTVKDRDRRAAKSLLRDLI
jgi:hypothetical protein